MFEFVRVLSVNSPGNSRLIDIHHLYSCKKKKRKRKPLSVTQALVNPSGLFWGWFGLQKLLHTTLIAVDKWGALNKGSRHTWDSRCFCGCMFSSLINLHPMKLWPASKESSLALSHTLRFNRQRKTTNPCLRFPWSSSASLASVLFLHSLRDLFQATLSEKENFITFLKHRWFKRLKTGIQYHAPALYVSDLPHSLLCVVVFCSSHRLYGWDGTRYIVDSAECD